MNIINSSYHVCTKGGHSLYKSSLHLLPIIIKPCPPSIVLVSSFITFFSSSSSHYHIYIFTSSSRTISVTAGEGRHSENRRVGSRAKMGTASYSYSSEIMDGTHKVAIPPPKPFFQSFKNTLKETFFPDDPLRQFKNQPRGRKFILGLQYVFPILEWGPRYSFEFLKADLIAGITIASLAIPQGISYAKLANLPPILGLCEC